MIRSPSPCRAVAALALLAAGLGACGSSSEDLDALAVLERARAAERELSYRGIRFERIRYDGGDLRCRVHVHHGPDRSAMALAESDLRRPVALAQRIVEGSDPVSIWLRAEIGSDGRDLAGATRSDLAARLNRVLLDDRPWNAELFAETAGALRAGRTEDTPAQRTRRRRALLASAYPGLVHAGEAGTREARSWMTEANEMTSRYVVENGEIAWLEAPERLLRSYRLTPDGSEPIAGRMAERYRVVARRPGRFSRRIWIDRANGFLLRDLAVDARGRVVEERRYEYVEFGVGAPDPGFGVARDDEEPSLEAIPFERIAESVAFAVYLPRALPAGFSTAPLDVRWGGDPTGPVHLTYGDGLARVVLRQRLARSPKAGGSDEVEVRRRIDGATTRLGLALPPDAPAVEIDVTSSNLDATLLKRVVASLRQGGAS